MAEEKKPPVWIEPAQRFPTQFNTTLAARAEFYAAMRQMSDEDYYAGREIVVKCQFRRGIEMQYRVALYKIGGKPRKTRTWLEMSTEIAEAIRMVDASGMGDRV